MKSGILAFFLLSSALYAADPPQAEISNGAVRAKIYLPDAQDGYYRGTRFDWSGVYYSRDTVHVLLSLDMEKSPAVLKPDRNTRPFFSRPDQDYAVAWIKSYGKGWVYYNSMGHIAETMMSKPIMGYVLAAVQFILGDLDADTRPSAKLARK